MRKTLREQLIEQGVVVPKQPDLKPDASATQPHVNSAAQVETQVHRTPIKKVDTRKFRGPHSDFPVRDEPTIKEIKRLFQILTDQLKALIATKNYPYRKRCQKLLAEIQRYQYHLSAQIPVVSNHETMNLAIRRINHEILSSLTPSTREIVRLSTSPERRSSAARPQPIKKASPAVQNPPTNLTLKNLKLHRQHWLQMIERYNRGQNIWHPNGAAITPNPEASAQRQLHLAICANLQSLQIARRNAAINASEIAAHSKMRHSTLSPAGFGIQNSAFRRFSR